MGNLRAIAIFVGFLLIVAIFTYPSWRPRPVLETAEDIFPELTSDLRPLFDTLPPDVQDIYLTLRRENNRIAGDLVTARLTPPERLIEDMPDISNAIPLVGGTFAPVTLPEDEVDRELPPYQSLYNETLGDIDIYRYPDERKFLRLENFSVVNGPDLHVYLSTMRDPLNLEELGSTYLDLGPLRSNSGNQTYEIPREANIANYASVVIFDRTSGHIFGVGRIG